MIKTYKDLQKAIPDNWKNCEIAIGHFSALDMSDVNKAQLRYDNKPESDKEST